MNVLGIRITALSEQDVPLKIFLVKSELYFILFLFLFVYNWLWILVLMSVLTVQKCPFYKIEIHVRTYVRIFQQFHLRDNDVSSPKKNYQKFAKPNRYNTGIGKCKNMESYHVCTYRTYVSEKII